MKLDGRSAIVTGGSGGLGAATVRHLVGLGVPTTILDLHASGADELRAELGDDVSVIEGSVLEVEPVDAAITTAGAHGRLSIVVNIAGGGIATRTLTRDLVPHDLESFAQVVSLNVVGSFNVSRLAAAAIAANEPDEHGERGVIVHTASIAAYEGQIGQVAYAAAKSAIVGMTLPMARDLGASGIRVCTIAPGLMGTPIMLSVPDEMRAGLEANVVHPKRLGEPEEFAMLVESIVCNPYLNGTTIRLDGGTRFPPR